MGRGDSLNVRHHLGVVVVALVPGRKVVDALDLRPRLDAETTQRQRARLPLRAVKLDVVGPIGLSDVIALGHQLGALLSRVHAVHDEALDLRDGRMARRSGHARRH